VKTIGIVGFGYVGMSMAKLFAGRFDFCVYDPAKGFDDKECIRKSDLVLICVPTPQRSNGDCDISLVVESVELFQHASLVCIKSTVTPGTTQSLIDRFGPHVHFSPEYVGEGKNHVPPEYLSPTEARSHPFCIVGGRRAQLVLNFFRRAMATSARYVAVADPTVVELAKYMENSYLATKVAFCNEFANIAKSFGVDYNDVRELWLHDPRVDPSHTLVFPERRGFDGKCLPKDLSAIRSAAHSNAVKTPLLNGVDMYNLEEFE